MSDVAATIPTADPQLERSAGVETLDSLSNDFFSKTSAVLHCYYYCHPPTPTILHFTVTTTPSTTILHSFTPAKYNYYFTVTTTTISTTFTATTTVTITAAACFQLCFYTSLLGCFAGITYTGLAGVGLS